MTLTELIAAATPGPWETDGAAIVDAATGSAMIIYDEGGHTVADAALIVAAVNKLPALIAALEAADAMRADFLNSAGIPVPRTVRDYDAARAAAGEV